MIDYVMEFEGPFGAMCNSALVSESGKLSLGFEESVGAFSTIIYETIISRSSVNISLSTFTSE